MSTTTHPKSEAYKELYAKIVFALDEIKDFLSDEDLRRRKFYRLLPILKEYLELLESSEEDNKRKGLLHKLLGAKPSSERDAEAFLRQNADSFLQLEDCARCKCLSCPKDCKMEGCSRCEPGHGCRVSSCDNKESAVWTYGFKTLELRNNDTGNTETFEVRTVVQDLQYKQLYIVLDRRGDKVILYYYPGLKGDDYGEIKDADDLNFAANAFENRNCE